MEPDGSRLFTKERPSDTARVGDSRAEQSSPFPSLAYHYWLYGLRVGSQFALPELRPRDRGESDVVIREGCVPERLDHPTGGGVCCQVSRDQFLLRVDGVARYLVSEGREVLVERAPEVDDDSVRLFLLDSTIGPLLYQKGLLPLHGSAIRRRDSSVLLLGHSGFGKSALAGAFRKRGHLVLADEISAVTFKDGVPNVLPGYPQIKLWGDVVEKLGLRADDFRRVRPPLEKYAVPLREAFCEDPLPLSRIYVLTPRNRADIALRPLKGGAAIQVLLTHSLHPRLVPGFGVRTSHFKQCADVARAASVIHVQRPLHAFMLDELLEELERDMTV